jgi:hypothetical protein
MQFRLRGRGWPGGISPVLTLVGAAPSAERAQVRWEDEVGLCEASLADCLRRCSKERTAEASIMAGQFATRQNIFMTGLTADDLGNVLLALSRAIAGGLPNQVLSG